MLSTFNFQLGRYSLLSVLMGMCGAAIVLLLFHVLEPPQRVATVDVTGIITRFVKKEANSPLSKSEIEKKVNVFGQTLDNTLKTMARNQQLILLPKEAVIAGTQDVTREIETKVVASLNSDQPKLRPMTPQ